MPIELLGPDEAAAAPAVELPAPQAPPPSEKPASEVNQSPLSRQEIVQRMADIKVERADRRKRRFLKVLKRTVALCMENPERPYPDIHDVCKIAKIPYGTYHAWKSEDPMFIAVLDEIEEIWLDDAVKVVHDAKRKNPYIALDLLRSRRRSKYGHQLNVSATFTHIHMVSNIVRPDVPVEPVKIDKNGRDRTRRTLLEAADEAEFEEDETVQIPRANAQEDEPPIENEPKSAIEKANEGQEGKD